MNLRDYLHIVNRHKLVLILVTLAAGGAALLISVRQAPRYQSSSQVLLSYENLPSLLTNSQNPTIAVPPDRAASTQAQLARVPAVARRALRNAGISGLTPSQLLLDSTVVSDPTSDLLTFTVAARSLRSAERLATAYARAYVLYRQGVDAGPFVAGSRQLARRLAQLRARGQAGSALFRELTKRQEQLSAFSALQTPDASVVRSATGGQQIQPRPVRALALGLPIGLLLGLVIVLLMHLLDTRARTTSEAEDALELPLLGWIPTPSRRNRNSVALLESPNGATGEAIASVRTNVDLARRVHDTETLLITTVAGRAPGVKSNAVANLGVAYARAGLHVAVVDLDLRSPSLATLFGLEPRCGVTEVLLGMADLQDALVPVSLQPKQTKQKKPKNGILSLGSVEFGGSLRVLPVATLASNTTDVIASRGIGSILEELRSMADLVLIDAPPLLEGSDVAALSTHVDAVAVIANVGTDRRHVLSHARRRLETLPATPLGWIATGRRDEQAHTSLRPDVMNRIRREAVH
jgi:polysaccharide biosynthesis transport protein